jgi:hypothetical protein
MVLMLHSSTGRQGKNRPKPGLRLRNPPIWGWSSFRLGDLHRSAFLMSRIRVWIDESADFLLCSVGPLYNTNWKIPQFYLLISPIYVSLFWTHTGRSTGTALDSRRRLTNFGDQRIPERRHGKEKNQHGRLLHTGIIDFLEHYLISISSTRDIVVSGDSVGHISYK